jgi:hypothetical protein
VPVAFVVAVTYYQANVRFEVFLSNATMYKLLIKPAIPLRYYNCEVRRELLLQYVYNEDNPARR